MYLVQTTGRVGSRLFPFRWGLRSLLSVLTLTACAMAAWRVWIAALREETKIIARLEGLGATTETVPAGADWLRKLPGQGRYRHATRLSLSPSSLPVTDDDVAALSKLRRLHELHVKPAAIVTAQHLRPLVRLSESLPALSSIRLQRAEISDAELPLLRGIRQLDAVSPGGNVTVRGVEELADTRPELDCGAPAESLYRSTIAHSSSFSASTIVDCLEAAAQWKQACSSFKSDPEAAQTARQQLVANYQRLLGEFPAVSRRRSVFLRELANLHAELAECNSDRAAALVERAAAASFAAEARERTWADYENNVHLVGDVIETVARWVRAEVALARLRGDADAELRALQGHVEQLDRLVNRVGPLFLHIARGGETSGLELAKVSHALARAELSRDQRDADQQQACLHLAASHATRLLPALDRAHRGGAVNAIDYLHASEIAAAAQLALVEATADGAAVSLARADAKRLIDRRWQRIFDAHIKNPAARPQITAFLICEQARRRLEQEGLSFYEGRFADISLPSSARTAAAEVRP
jgi:hypothetical protein